MKLSYMYYMKGAVLHTKLGILELYIIALVDFFVTCLLSSLIP
jgi:hypothetical protein